MRQRQDAIVRRLIDTCWYFFKAGLAVALIAAAATGAYLYVRMDDEIRKHAEAFLAERYPHLAVSVGGARRIDGKGIAIYDLSLSEPGANGGRPLLAIDEMVLVCDAQLKSLMQGVPEVQRVEVRRPKLALRLDRSGRWNIESLLPLKPCGSVVPQVVIRDGSATIGQEDGGEAALGEIELELSPIAQAAAPGSCPSVRLSGTLSGPQVERLVIDAELLGAEQQCKATVGITRFKVNEQIVAWARAWLPESFQATSITGIIDGKIAVTWPWAESGGAPVVRSELSVSGGRIEDRRLPAPITEASGRAVITASELRFEELRGKCGAATVAMSANRSGWSAGAPMALSARVTDAILDEPLYRALPPFLRLQWDKFRPTGVVDATLHATYDGQTWRPVGAEAGGPAAMLTGRNLSFESEKFAYRLSGGVGTISFFPASADQPPRLDFDVTGHGGGQPVRIVGQVFDPRPGAAGWAEIRGENLEIEPAMIEAMQPRPREVVAKLHPAGRFNLAWRIERPQPDGEARTALRMDLVDVRINYDEFAYPLQNIRGQIAAEGNYWTFSNLESGGRRMIRAEGYLRPAPEGSELRLTFNGQQVPLDDALFDALREPVQRAWVQLQPRGEVDLTAVVRHRTGQGQPNIAVSIRPRESAQLQPEFFKYRLERMTGDITYDDGNITLTDVRAQHDGIMMGANGQGYFAPDGGWWFKLIGLWVDRLRASPDLTTALPEQLGRLIERLRPTGSFSLQNGVLAFRKAPSEIAHVETEWDVELDCHQTDLHCGLDLQNIHGTVRLKGQADGQRSSSAGELNLESLSFQDVQFTSVRGPMWVDETECRLGKWATEIQGLPERSISASAYGGGLVGNAWARFDGRPQYGAEARLTGADLHRMIVERFGGQQPFQGKVDADVILSGEGPSLPRLGGEGHVQIREANIYELPLLASLLKMLRTGAPDKTAFTQSDIVFRIQGQHIYLDKIDFLGDVVNLYGKGETDFDQRLNLIFSGDILRRDYQLPLVGNLVGQAREQFLRMYVGGTLSEPLVTTEALPGLNQMFQQIRSDLETPMGPTEGRQAQRVPTRTGPPGRQ